MVTYQIAPSLLAADFNRLGEQVAAIEEEADLLHLDLMDGHFVPNLSFGPAVIAGLRKLSELRFDCHLMTTNPDAYLPELVKAGVDLVTMHIEAIPDPTHAARRARAEGLDFGLVISPPTPVEAVLPFLEDCSLLLIMSVNPGFGGQSFIPKVLSKVESARNWIESHGLKADIEIDGGISTNTIVAARDAGANVFVAGTAVFGEPDPAAAVRDLRKQLEQA
ncbi:MAG: ribulose-phosphate 3-epimerase [Actinobacteria bacterium]|nr:ribulose-phosphate 3-epimerase [Acidimicrobiia bacterium]MCA1737166.1 ribulose-phosphate 3-epimerase [Actinomycetota bacterium]